MPPRFLAPPSCHDHHNQRHRHASSGNPRIVANSRGKKRLPGTRSLSSALKCSDRGFVDLIQGCLHWDMKKRLQPDECLNHPWIVNAMMPASAYRQQQQQQQQQLQQHGGGHGGGSQMPTPMQLQLAAYGMSGGDGHGISSGRSKRGQKIKTGGSKGHHKSSKSGKTGGGGGGGGGLKSTSSKPTATSEFVDFMARLPPIGSGGVSKGGVSKGGGGMGKSSLHSYGGYSYGQKHGNVYGQKAYKNYRKHQGGRHKG